MLPARRRARRTAGLSSPPDASAQDRRPRVAALHLTPSTLFCPLTLLLLQQRQVGSLSAVCCPRCLAYRYASLGPPVAPPRGPATPLQPLPLLPPACTAVTAYPATGRLPRPRELPWLHVCHVLLRCSVLSQKPRALALLAFHNDLSEMHKCLRYVDTDGLSFSAECARDRVVGDLRR